MLLSHGQFISVKAFPLVMREIFCVHRIFPLFKSFVCTEYFFYSNLLCAQNIFFIQTFCVHRIFPLFKASHWDNISGFQWLGNQKHFMYIIQVFWDVTLCCWASVPSRPPCPLKIKVLWPSETSEATNLATERHIPKDTNLQQDCCESLKSITLLYLPLHVSYIRNDTISENVTENARV